VQMMAGKIWVESQPGTGSCFHFTMEALLTHIEESAEPNRAVHLEGLPVLIVDDNAGNRRILAEMAEAEGLKPSLAESAADALRQLQAAAARDAAFKLLLLDCHMPEVDGFTLVEQIRQLDPIAGTITLMLTSASHRGDAARCRTLGVAAYLTKPVSQCELVGAIRMALGRNSERSDPTTLITRHSLPVNPFKLRILLAEDSPVNQRVARGVLEKQGHSVIVAGTGCEVLLALERQSFDLIVMDIQMPEMDGLETTAAIRAREGNAQHIPIIALTAHAMAGDRERCRAAGMDGYITKPIRVPDLIGEVNRVQNAVGHRLGSERLISTAL
jgi:two-component system, sensor histidine kinase and response regulator